MAYYSYACFVGCSSIFTYASFDIAALLSVAQSIRGKGCTCDESQRPKGGSFNWVIFIAFEDGVEWVFRSPQKAFGLQEGIAGEVLLSEVATLQYLGKNGSIPVPEVYSYCPTRQNPVGIPYVLMSKATGVPLSTHKWSDDMIPPPKTGNAYPQATLTSCQKQKIMEQLGKIYACMSNMRLDKVGSLYPKDKSYVVGRCLYPTLVWNGRDEFDEQDIPRGPFTEPESFYSALILAFNAHVKELPMGHHLFHGPVPVPEEYDNFNEYRTATDRWNDYVAVGSKAESTQNSLDYALVGISLKDRVPSLVERDHQIKCTGYPLCHPDLSTQNIFVDDALNITCIIDWAFASFVPPSMLLICPGLPHPRDRPQSPLETPFARAFDAAQGFDGDKDLQFSNGNILWAFLRLVNLDALQDHDYFSGFRRLLGDPEVDSHLRQLKDRDEFNQISRMILEYDEEEPSENEMRYFSCVGQERLALSRHLTVMAELNKGFLADKRLWHWIARYLNEKELYMHSSPELEKRGRKRRISQSL
ncbi:hypothetical protein P170DRAFT_446580 [Aspergillus steynii IBT 23096]|uniref:Aminoglycoside phosphotransferase domain-containing protein n=1 Tax=Aspergillus steynii IBT 23096 TaxID=1392250 RepID=A0A2I2G785_9EURO|nr:uncharacterized protein P170DRAFT_446580 [Aspergillus steynii IBT 23096]PLB48747.1 hypothetical protein P170DRAFT_446580 [Aspergillus steynii IBT 23096]